MMNLLDLYQADAPGKVFAAAGNKEYRGPCPLCGGTDRFGVFPQQNDGVGSFFCGRQKGGGNGCGIGGDAISYLRQVRKLTYHQACDFLGIEAKGSNKRSTKFRYLPETPASRQEIFVPEDKKFPAEVVDPQLWQTKGQEFVEKCHQALQNRPMSIVYLKNRGIGPQSIKKHKLGFWGGDERNGLEYQTSYRPRTAWGLSKEKNENGKPRMMALPAGLVIPYFVDGLLHRITIRLIKPDPKTPKKKYHYVTGSIRDLWLTNPTAKAFVTHEAELDCIAIEEAAGDLVGTVGIGSTGVRPDLCAATALQQSLCILGGLDFDGIGSKASQAVIQSGEWWQETYQQYRRWPVPTGKDAGEFFQSGGNLRLWIMAGLPDFLVPAQDGIDTLLSAGDDLKIEIDPGIFGQAVLENYPGAENVQTSEDVAVVSVSAPRTQEATGNQLPASDTSSTANDLAELKELLRQSRGYVRIFDGGVNVAKEVPKKWREENFAASGRISWLLNNSLVVADWVGNVGDGMYKSEDIRC